MGIKDNEQAHLLAMNAIINGIHTQKGVPPKEFKNCWVGKMGEDLRSWCHEQISTSGA